MLSSFLKSIGRAVRGNRHGRSGNHVGELNQQR
jgi:hypothetical protein